VLVVLMDVCGVPVKLNDMSGVGAAVANILVDLNFKSFTSISVGVLAGISLLLLILGESRRPTVGETAVEVVFRVPCYFNKYLFI